MDTDPPPLKTSETPAPKTPTPVWPPTPTAPPPPMVAPPTRRRTLTYRAWLDGLLGLPVGFVGAALLYVAVRAVGDSVTPSPGTDVTACAELCVFAALTVTLCLLTVRRVPFFGGSLMLGALVVLMLACLEVWI